MSDEKNSLRFLSETRSFIYRLSGPLGAPVLVYLPGVHGDWTSFLWARKYLSAALRVVEVAYPQRPEWGPGDFAGALRELFEKLGVASAHLLAESFGSIPAWQFAGTYPHAVQSLTFAAGFSRPPYVHAAGGAARILRLIPAALFEAGVDWYLHRVGMSGWKRPPPEEGIPPFPAVRSRAGHRALCSRLSMIQKIDFSTHLLSTRHPVFYIGGGRDRIVPVRREIRTLEALLPAESCFEHLLLPRAGHLVLVTHARECSAQVIHWVESRGNARGDGMELG